MIICIYIYVLYMNNCVWDGMGRWDVMWNISNVISVHVDVPKNNQHFHQAAPAARPWGLDGFRGPNGFHHFAVAMEVGLPHAPAANDRLLLLMPKLLSRKPSGCFKDQDMEFQDGLGWFFSWF